MPSSLSHEALERIALTSLRVGKILSESGSAARIVHEAGRMVVEGLGATHLGFRTGYASLTVTVGSGKTTVSRMLELSRYGVNHRLDHRVRALVANVATGSLSPAQVDDALAALEHGTPRHPAWLVALAVGMACACFGRLFGMDWIAFPFVFAASALAQFFRHVLARRGMNMFVVATLVAFVAAFLSGLGAQKAGSATVGLGMIASILLLVPGVPATNAQADIMDGYPTLGSARAISVTMTMVFATVGVWLAQTLLGVHL